MGEKAIQVTSSVRLGLPLLRDSQNAHFKRLGLLVHLICLLCIVVTSPFYGAYAVEPVAPTLQNLVLSHGLIQFQPNKFSYSVTLETEYENIQVLPFVNNAGSSGNSYSVTVNKNSVPNDTGVVSVPIPKKKPFNIVVVVKDLKNNKESEYVVAFTQNFLYPDTTVHSITLKSDKGSPPFLKPAFNRGVTQYELHAHQTAKSVTVSFACPSGSTVNVNGKHGVSSITIQNKKNFSELGTISCSKSEKNTSYSTNYAFQVFFDVGIGETDIPPPSELILANTGDSCKLNGKIYNCHSNTTTAIVIPSLDKQFSYVVRDDSKNVLIRLINKEASAPIPLHSNLILEASSGLVHRQWPLEFTGPFFPSHGNFWTQSAGTIFAISFGLTIFTLVIIVNLSSLIGIGSPHGASEVPSLLTLLVQFFCFANISKGYPTMLSDMTASLKFATLWWPLPWMKSEVSLSTIENALGCLFWSACIFLTILLIHSIFILSLHNKTLPHRLNFGYWESCTIHFLSFPVVAAASTLIFRLDSVYYWRILGATVLAIPITWLALNFSLVLTSVKNEEVVWVWDTSENEGLETVDTGYWADAVCDQLNTESQETYISNYLFPWKWVTCVADIEPVPIQSESDQYPGYEKVESTIAKAPLQVDVLRTRSALLCAGFHYIAGLFRTNWIDILFTFNTIADVSKWSTKKKVGLVIPLTVKTNQLAGPLTNGRYCFFFEGVRMPFVRFLDSAVRILIGICFGLIISYNSVTLQSVVYSLMSAFVALGVIYTLVKMPLTRSFENFLLAFTFFIASLVSLALMLNNFTKPYNVEIMLWISSILLFILALYSLAVCFFVISSFVFPPLTHYRFLSKLCNSRITISDHEAGFNTKSLGYNRYGARNTELQLVSNGSGVTVMRSQADETEATLEFSVYEIAQACKSANLQLPIACLYMPNSDDRLKYSHLNIYNRDNLFGQVHAWLRQCFDESYLSLFVNQVVEYIDTHLSDLILVLTIFQSDGSLVFESDSYDQNFTRSIRNHPNFPPNALKATSGQSQELLDNSSNIPFIQKRPSGHHYIQQNEAAPYFRAEMAQM